jgi:homoserine kinase type II
MLWETADPTEQLTRRFGFLDGPSAVGWVADSLQRQWQLQVTGCDRLVISAWNAMAWVTADDRRLIAKWSALPQLFANLLDAARVTTWLERCGLPVAAPIPATDDRLLVEVPTQADGHVHARRPLGESRALLGVTRVVDGDLLDSDDLGQVTDAGQMLAAVHEALAAYPDEVGGRRPRGQEQLVHNDFRSANILHDGARVTAVLDFEEVAYDSRVADLAKSAVLLGTRYRGWGPTSDGTRRAFVAAYGGFAHRPLTGTEQQELEQRINAGLRMKGWM